ncbi:MAG: acetylglutamate kinase [Buchnera aphidicola (Brevicoryne brassicae)]|uniref:Acetylglutamate kinase n=1 Tax=Buchnera aphidicola (Brevicoryne brassicae) TaxID=911343 RepID=A0AAJ5PU76_9GAMM|nr:acetylglutamate kinase [Buchnera aphidicola]QCI19633.1 acetylglutamate kinase [Buchnera aphidicola (Brevicoryne brassicae)]WAI19004.1 MAG: acetylglutamate kinase [Buchnera aphidicola (Brevicoryne brassicae)]
MNPLVIKLGGVLLESDNAMTRLFEALVDYRKSYKRYVLIIHGGGRLIDDLMKKLNLPVKKKNGLRVTLSEHINVITGALSGTANKTLLARALKHNINAVGLCLADGKSVDVEKLDKDLGHVGKAIPGSPLFLNKLCKEGILPIISSIGITNDGLLMNVNADLAAAALATTLHANLILLSDISSILDGKGQRIEEINSIQAKKLITQGIITNGMIVKVNAALEAANILNRAVDIASWQNAEELELLFNGVNIGTRVSV